MSFDADQRWSEVYLVTFVLELPADLRMPDNSGVVSVTDEEGRFDGWPKEAVVALVGGQPLKFADGMRPATRIVFRRTRVRTDLPLQTADVTFGRWAARLMTRRARVARWLRLRFYIRRGLSELRSVAALTRFVNDDQLPDPGGEVLDFLMDKEGLFDTEFDAALRDLNDFLVALGVSVGGFSVGPIAPADIPAQVPVIVERSSPSPAGRAGWTELHDVHFRLPDLVADELDAATLENAVTLFNAVQDRVEPLLGFYESWRQAELSAAGGRHSQAILELGVAMEVLFSALLREIGSRRGLQLEPLLGSTGPGLKGIVVDHLSRHLNTPLGHSDLASAGHPLGWWWVDGYKLRNQVAHQGHRADGGEVEAAVAAARAAVAWLGSTLSQTADLGDLGHRLSWLVRARADDEDDEDDDCDEAPDEP